MNDVKITERGWAGHFICSENCLFRRNTLIEYGDKKWVVSTIGNMWHPVTNKLMTIGLGLWYETKAFEACDIDGYIDADIKKELNIESECGLYAATEEELYEKYPLTDNAANEMHDNIVKEMVEKIIK